MLTAAFCAALLLPEAAYIERERQYLPVLCAELAEHWPDAPAPSTFAAQVQQETCPSLKSKLCWNPKAELKTSREYGFGLGQLTVTSKFDNFQAAKKLHPRLADWQWESRYSPAYQLRTMVLMNRFAYGKLGWATSVGDRQSFMFAAYNGGLGGVLSDRKVCAATPGCDVNRWFGHVEHTSKKAKTAANGYGQGFFQINRAYVRNVMGPRRSRYIDALDAGN